jgi:putative spermidine/putrescine transport system permease protein
VIDSPQAEGRDAPLARPVSPWRGLATTWLAVLPFFAFAVLFIFYPSIILLVQGFQNDQGGLTLANFGAMFTGLTVTLAPSAITLPGGLSVTLVLPQVALNTVLSAYWISIRISLATAIGGGLFGFVLAYAVILGGLPRWVRSALMTFSGVASNFAGVPLAFAFIATMGRIGFVTLLLKSLGIDVYAAGFSLYNFWGLSFTYMYFQFPLMVLIMSPALEGLKREWREAAENLGASSFQYWRHVALPILLPSVLGTMVLLFGNAFGAYATAEALTGGQINLVTILIGSQIQGDALHNPGLGYALALGMIVIMVLVMIPYQLLRRVSERWLR